METKKKIRISIKHRKPARKQPADAPVVPTGAGRNPPGKREVSPLLTDMLSKLAGWTPSTNEGVLEVANRLAQAAREEIDRDTVKKAKTDAAKFAKGLESHTLTYWNGVSSEHRLVLGVEQDKSGSTIKFRMLTVFNYNRIGPPAILYTVRETVVSEIRPPSKDRRNEVGIHGKFYRIDVPGAMDTVMTEVERYREQLELISANGNAGKRKKRWPKNRNLTR